MRTLTYRHCLGCLPFSAFGQLQHTSSVEPSEPHSLCKNENKNIIREINKLHIEADLLYKKQTFKLT